MNAPILETKFLIPESRKFLVHRRRLLDKLQEGAEQKLTLVTAPAGYGKTVVVSDWIRKTNPKAAWLSLDDGDNDPIRFLAHFIAALKKLDIGVGETALAVIESSQNYVQEEILTILINEVYFAINNHLKQNQTIHLILDDYHTIHNSSVHNSLSFILDHSPPQFQMVIISRTKPPFPLSRLRARAQLCAITAEDLKFNLEETSSFVFQVMNLNISPEDLIIIHSKTEGWIAGIQLAALTLRSTKDVKEFILAFSESHRFVLDYLEDEVFNLLKPEQKTFLLYTSILEQMTGDLCNAVTLEMYGGHMLKTLQEADLFVVSLDQEGQWYRYHPLFHDMLRDRLMREMPSFQKDLHLRASQWYEQKGMFVEAFGHALEAREYTRAVNLFLENNPTDMIMRGELTRLQKWLDSIPADLVKSIPRLSLAYAWLLLFSANREAIEPYLINVMEALGLHPSSIDSWPIGLEENQMNLLGEVAAIRSSLASTSGHKLEAIELAQKVLAHTSEKSLFTRSIALLILGDAYNEGNELKLAEKAYTEGLQISQELGNIVGTMQVTRDLGRVLFKQGLLHQASRLFHQVVEMASPFNGPLYPLGQALSDLGAIYYEWNLLDDSRAYFEKTVNQCQSGGYQRFLLHAYLGLGKLELAEGQTENAEVYLGKARRLVGKIDNPRLQSLMNASEVNLFLAQQRSLLCERWADYFLQEVDQLPFSLYEIEYFTFFKLARTIQGKHLKPAFSILQILADKVKASGRSHTMIIAETELAAFNQVIGKHKAAMQHMRQALEYAAPEGYIRTFIDAGSPFKKLLEIALTSNLMADMVSPLLQTWDHFDSHTLSHTNLDILTERERQILSMVASGLSNREISDKLVITIPTVKTHIHNIYRKLNIGNRVEARIFKEKYTQSL